jgi:hypothetical protein
MKKKKKPNQEEEEAEGVDIPASAVVLSATQKSCRGAGS